MYCGGEPRTRPSCSISRHTRRRSGLAVVNPADSQSTIIRGRIRLCARTYPSVLFPQASHSVSALNTSHLQFCKTFLRAGRRVVAIPYRFVRRVESRLLPLSFLGSIVFQPPSNSGIRINCWTPPPPKSSTRTSFARTLSPTPRHVASHICEIIWTTRATFSY